jgi:chromosome segregation ATPase
MVDMSPELRAAVAEMKAHLATTISDMRERIQHDIATNSKTTKDELVMLVARVEKQLTDTSKEADALASAVTRQNERILSSEINIKTVLTDLNNVSGAVRSLDTAVQALQTGFTASEGEIKRKYDDVSTAITSLQSTVKVVKDDVKLIMDDKKEFKARAKGWSDILMIAKYMGIGGASIGGFELFKWAADQLAGGN